MKLKTLARKLDKSELPLVPLRELVVFPYMVVPFFVGRDTSIKAVEEAMAGDRLVFLACQKNNVDRPAPDDIYTAGTVAKILQMLKLPDGTIRVLAEGQERGIIHKYLRTKDLFHVSATTISRVLRAHGIDPCDERPERTTWNEFIKSHWDSLAAIDFFHKDIWTAHGLVRYMVLVVIDYKTRKVQIAGIIPQANGDWMKQMARNLTDPIDGFLKGKKYLVHDWDSLFTEAFKGILKAGGITCKKTSVACPNMNPFVERFVRSIKHECLNKMLIFGESHLRYCVNEYIEHYHTERPHQGIGNNIIEPQPQPKDGEIICHERLGGLLKSYRRAA